MEFQQKRQQSVTELCEQLKHTQYNFISTYIPQGCITFKDDLRKIIIDENKPFSRTSGSTGTPVMVNKTEESIIWHIATNKRELEWRGWPVLDSNFKKVSILARNKEDSFDEVTGVYSKKLEPISILQSYLEKIQPHYIYSYPSIIEEIDLSKLKNLIDIRSCGERNATSYSCEEAGTIALKCPEFGNYHIMENIIVESDPELGALITELTNPIINRYAIGDVIELPNKGVKCGCGRSLPIISKIQGRIRNMLVLPNGDKVWPTVGEPQFLSISKKIIRHQVVQKTFYDLEIRLKVSHKLDFDEETNLKKLVLNTLNQPHINTPTIVYVDDFPLGKFEAFKCDINN